MNDNDMKQTLRALRTIATCAVISTTVFVLMFLAQIFQFHL